MSMLKDLLYAKSIAVVGASADPLKMGHVILRNLLDGGYLGGIYPVNLKEESILGIACVRSVSEIPGPLDLAVICVPARFAASVMREAGEKGAKGAIVISGGFKEAGNDELERELLDEARRHGIRVIGPNCQGVNFTGNRMCATWPLIQKRGAIGIVSQSGTIGAEMELRAERDGIGVSCFAALGNKSDVDEADFISFFAEDPNTKVIALNVEGIQDAGRFIGAVTKAAAVKPVVILKPGRTEKGRRAVSSHTKSVAGNDRVFSAFCRKHGILRADTMDEFYDYCKLAACAAKLPGRRVLIVTSSGGAGILATDTAEVCGLDIAALPAPLREALGDALPPHCVLSNPLDLTGDATAERYGAALGAVAPRDDYDAVLVIFGDPIPGACRALKELDISVPVVACYLGGGDVQEEEVAAMNGAGIPVFSTPERAVRAMSALAGRPAREGRQG